jgi:asparagine synthase (glutamine-hydrolysing)
MCGIVGLLDAATRRGADATDRLLDDMAQRMHARGPDADGRWVDASVGIGLGHRRLSILDLSPTGAQPMVSADGRWVITYNGEIYDHAALAADLNAAGTRLRGHSDTEILVEAIARWGVRATLQRIDGMFAFGVWDRHERRLTLARDRMGEKPLYYGSLGNGEFVFGSTLDALRAHPAWDRPVDLDALALFFRHKYVPAPMSIFEGISKLEPGCTLEVDASGSPGSPVPYWSWFEVVGRGTTFEGSDREAVDELDRLLRRSVRRRMVADVPVGAFLSGGIDSSSVVAAAQQESSVPVRTFTIGSDEAGYDESSDARAVAERLGTNHTELVVTDDVALDAVHRLGAVTDEPFGDSSLLPTLLVSELARREVTVALSGDAGDELFSGYNRYVWVQAIWNRLGAVPVGARRTMAGVGRRVPPHMWDRAAQVLPASRRPRHLGLKVSKVLGIADAADEHEVFLRLVSHWQDPERLVPGSEEPPTVHTDPSRWPRTDDIVGHMAAVDAVTYLPDDILAKVDRASMAVSLEGRIPLLDVSIVEFAAGLPSSMKLRGGTSKWILREVLDRSVPREVFARPKSGFGVPIESWLRGPLREWAGEHLHGPAVASVLDTSMVETAWQDHLTGRRNQAYELWDVVMFSAWCEARGISPA